LDQVNELDEIRQTKVKQTYLVQQQRAKWHDKFLKRNQFEAEYWELLFDSRFKNFKGKLKTRWLGPYDIEEVFDNGVVKIKTIDDQHVSILVNGHMLQLYHKPLTKKEFMKKVTQQDEIEVVRGRFDPSTYTS
jgi:hypothetical protein